MNSTHFLIGSFIGTTLAACADVTILAASDVTAVKLFSASLNKSATIKSVYHCPAVIKQINDTIT